MNLLGFISIDLIKSSVNCVQCGTRWPALKGESRSIQLGKWCCSPDCYQAWLDAQVAPLYADGSGSPVFGGKVGAGRPSIRVQVNAALEKWELAGGEPVHKSDRQL